jgi:hypothetical protein
MNRYIAPPYPDWLRKRELLSEISHPRHICHLHDFQVTVCSLNRFILFVLFNSS